MFCLFTNPSRWKCASSLNHRQSKVSGNCCTNWKKSERTHTSAACKLQWVPVPLGFCKITMSNPSAWWYVLTLFWCWVTGNSMLHIFSDYEAVLRVHKQHCLVCVLTCAFPPHLPCCCRHYQLIQTSVPDSWLQVLLVPVACWISSETLFALLLNYWFSKMFQQ
jgi:hypothetical protein